MTEEAKSAGEKKHCVRESDGWYGAHLHNHVCCFVVVNRLSTRSISTPQHKCSPTNPIARSRDPNSFKSMLPVPSTSNILNAFSTNDRVKPCTARPVSIYSVAGTVRGVSIHSEAGSE